MRCLNECEYKLVLSNVNVSFDSNACCNTEEKKNQNLYGWPNVFLVDPYIASSVTRLLFKLIVFVLLSFGMFAVDRYCCWRFVLSPFAD